MFRLEIQNDVRELMADRESLTFGPVVRVDADVVLAAAEEGPAGLVRSQIGLPPQHGVGFLDISLDPDRYAVRIDLAHKLARLYDRREFIHRDPLRQVFCESSRSVSDTPAARSRGKRRPQRP